MRDTVRITSKRQITIPAKLFKALQLQTGDELIVEMDEGAIKMKKALAILDELSGSLAADLPKKYKNKSLDSIIQEAKSEYFAKKK